MHVKFAWKHWLDQYTIFARATIIICATDWTITIMIIILSYELQFVISNPHPTPIPPQIWFTWAFIIMVQTKAELIFHLMNLMFILPQHGKSLYNAGYNAGQITARPTHWVHIITMTSIARNDTTPSLGCNYFDICTLCQWLSAKLQ